MQLNSLHPDKKINTGIIVAGILLFIVSLTGLRTQTLIGDVQYMNAMIPHHSSAIMTSTNANIKDPELKKLADEIIAAQKREIAQMETILKRLKK